MQQFFPDERYVVKLDIFEGPLDLLLHLIRKHELDIFDIPISFITSKYLEYLGLMKQLNLDLASEYLEMAATLAYIKSRLLLPSEPAGEDELEEEGPDPREELIRQLLEYQKYKVAAEELAGRPLLGRDTFPMGSTEEIEVERDLAKPDLFALMEAFKRVLQDAEFDPSHEVSVTRITVSERINQLVDLLRGKRRFLFKELFEDRVSRSDFVVTFLSILEMARLGLMRVKQVSLDSEIHVVASDSILEADKILSTQLMEEQ